MAMEILKKARHTARQVLGSQLTELLRRPFRPKLGSISHYRSALKSKRGLEIGGPSPMLADSGPMPIYDVLGSLDNCLYSATTIWTGDVGEGGAFVWQRGKQPGIQIICDATDLQPVKNSRYDCVISCHSLEHVANPLRALAEWKRVLTDEGLLLLILPHKDGTFDWRRPVTPLDHLVEDYEREVGEDDLTHLPEILELHDLSKDLPAGTKEQFRERCLANRVHRAMHHHVFDTLAALQTVNYTGFQILRVDTLKPFHIIILARLANQTVDNHSFLGRGAQQWGDSPFPSDHEHADAQV